MTTKAKTSTSKKGTSTSKKGTSTSKKKSAPPTFVAGGHSNTATFTAERPGVLAELYRLMWQAEQDDAPLSKAEVLAHCVEVFADREPAKMKATISAQLPGQFKLERGYILTRVIGEDNVTRFKLDSAASERYIVAELAATGAAKFKRPLPWPAVTKEGRALGYRGDKIESAK